MLYHQNYCGCIYALSKQKGQKAFIDELMSPINKQILPASIEEKITFYERVKNLEKKEVKFKIQREKFLNYRLLSALIKQDKKPIKAYILFYSHFKNAYTKFSTNEENLSHYESVKDEINLWSFEYFNSLCKMRFKNFEDFLQNPLKIEQEIKIRQKHFGAYDLSPVIIVENIIKGAYEFMAKSEIYFDSKEKIVKL